MRGLLDRLPLRLAEIVAVVVALSVGYLVTSHVDILGGDEPAFVRSAALGRTAHLSYGDVRVHDVRTAHALAPPISSDPAVVSSTVFVVLVAELTATREPTAFSSV